MTLSQKIKRTIIGEPLDPLKNETRQHIVLIAFLAWVGLGADGLSSSCYGPEEAFKALGTHTHLALYLALATALTVFIISLAYNQVIELFPDGGGGYKVATQLIGPYAGLVSGSALILDYVLTIAISIASGVDAVFSLMPLSAQGWKFWVEIALLLLLLILNLRGMKESIKVMLPIFLGFFITHVFLIAYGIYVHADALPMLVPITVTETGKLTHQMGWIFVASLFLRAYSLGGGTYTGIEAVSNNVQSLKEPRVKTGRMTMFYMALSLSFTAGGIILLYLLWDVKVVAGQTLNAVTFEAIIKQLNWGGTFFNSTALWITLALEGGLLFVAANTGFLGGPAVLANMAADSWMPHQFRYLSTRLVTQHGILVMGVAALAILIWTHGDVALLVVLYSINVFLTFSLSLAGLCNYWWKECKQGKPWIGGMALSVLGLMVTASILVVTLVEKFSEGGWLTVLITSAIIGLCLMVRNHYNKTRLLIRKVDNVFAAQPLGGMQHTATPYPQQQTAVFVVGSSRGGALHSILTVKRMFHDHFKNFLLLNVRTVDAKGYGGDKAIAEMTQQAHDSLAYLEDFCRSYGMPSKSYLGFGTDAIESIISMAQQIHQEFPNTIFFASKLIFQDESWIDRFLHNQAALALQRKLHLVGIQMIILPMKL